MANKAGIILHNSMPSGIYKRTKKHIEIARNNYYKRLERGERFMNGKSNCTSFKKGHKHSLDVIEKLRIANIGKKRGPLSLEVRKKMSEIRKGANNWNWKGGIWAKNLKKRGTFEYKLWREEVYKRDDYTCKICGEKGGKLNADHIKPFAYFPELRLEVSNGRTLCVECHRKTDTYGWQIYNKRKGQQGWHYQT